MWPAVIACTKSADKIGADVDDIARGIPFTCVTVNLD